MKKLGLLMLLFATLLTVTACGDNGEGTSQPQENTEPTATVMPSAGAIPDVSHAEIAEVTDDDLADIPEGAYVLPLTELATHELAILFDDEGWELCHLMGTCAANVAPMGLALVGDELNFLLSNDARIIDFFVTGYESASCWANEQNNLLICEGFSVGDEVIEMMGRFDPNETEQMTVLLTDETTFEWVTNDQFTRLSQEEITRSEFEMFINNSAAVFSLNIRYEEVSGELVATHIQILEVII
ncbi:MAG: hypothetical protein FWE07_08905 [Turicibacter sp.]|nr:hypothetical protein [Turicibacter sp.]